MKSKFYAWCVMVVGVIVLAVVLGSMNSHVTAAPMAVPTPSGATERNAVSPEIITLFNAEPLTADTTSTCQEVKNWDIADLYYSVDQGAGVPNTTTLTLKFGNSASALVSGLAVATSNSADTSDLQQYQLFGRWACIFADVSNTNTLTITVNALVK